MNNRQCVVINGLGALNVDENRRWLDIVTLIDAMKPFFHVLDTFASMEAPPAFITSPWETPYFPPATPDQVGFKKTWANYADLKRDWEKAVSSLYAEHTARTLGFGFLGLITVLAITATIVYVAYSAKEVYQDTSKPLPVVLKEAGITQQDIDKADEAAETVAKNEGLTWKRVVSKGLSVATLGLLIVGGYLAARWLR